MDWPSTLSTALRTIGAEQVKFSEDEAKRRG